MQDLDELLRRAAGGDEHAFAETVDRTSTPLFRVALRMLGIAADAEEVLQESFVRAYDALRSGRYRDGSRPYAWLLAIVTRASVDALRRRKVRPVPVGGPDETWLVADGGHAERVTRVRELLASMDALPPDQRVALVLRHLEGLSNPEIAGVLAISEGAVEQRLMRARAALRRKLDGSDED